MRINLNNYEEWLMDYLDGNLDDHELKEMKAFLLKHPHIAEDLDGISEILLEPDGKVSLDHSFKSKIFQLEIQSTENISAKNFESYFVAFHEGDLEEVEQQELGDFLEKNNFLKSDFEKFGLMRLQADESISFPNKEANYKKEKKPIPIWAWSGIAAAILLIGFWIANTNQDTHPVFAPHKISSKSISSLAIKNKAVHIPNRGKLIAVIHDEIIEIEKPERIEIPITIAALEISNIEIENNNWKIQMELMQGYAFERNQLKSQVDWAAIPSENSKKGIRLITSFLWKTTKAQVQSLGEEVLNSNLQALTSSDIESLSGGIISVKRPAKEVE